MLVQKKFQHATLFSSYYFPNFVLIYIRRKLTICVFLLLCLFYLSIVYRKMLWHKIQKINAQKLSSKSSKLSGLHFSYLQNGAIIFQLPWKKVPYLSNFLSAHLLQSYCLAQNQPYLINVWCLIHNNKIIILITIYNLYIINNK